MKVTLVRVAKYIFQEILRKFCMPVNAKHELFRLVDILGSMVEISASSVNPSGGGGGGGSNYRGRGGRSWGRKRGGGGGNGDRKRGG